MGCASSSTSPRVSTARCTPRSAASVKNDAALGAAWCSRSIARCARPARLCSTRAWICADRSICCAAIEAARMHGEHVGALDDAHGVEAGEHFQGAAHVGVRDRVIVQVEAHVRGLRCPHDDAFLAGKGLCSATRAVAAAPPRSMRARCGLDLPDTAARPPRLDTRASAWAFRSARSVKRRAAKKRSRTKRIARSTRPFSLPRATATGRGWKRYQAASSSSVGWKRIASARRSSTALRKLSYSKVLGTALKWLKAAT